MPAGAPRRVLEQWPANCTAGPPEHKGGAIFVEAICQTGADVALVVRRDLTGTLDREYRLTTSSRIDRAGFAAQALPTSALNARYIGPCAGAPTKARESLPGERASPGLIVGYAAVWLAQMLAFLGFVYASFRGTQWMVRRSARGRYEQGQAAEIAVDQAGVAHIPVLATFTGVRGLPWWYGIAVNNAWPSLAIGDRGICFRVVRQRHRSFADIACVDVRQAPGTVNLDVAFHGSLLTFAANVGAVPIATRALSLFPASVPLTDRAVAVRDAGW
jgi:hypothetical protein